MSSSSQPRPPRGRHAAPDDTASGRSGFSRTGSGRHAAAPTGPPLSLRSELRRQTGRRRTLWAFALLLALPLVLVAAFAIGRSSGPATGTRLVDLATLGSANFTLFTLVAASEFLLLVLVALFAGDPVPSEASWSTLRYLLVAPVPRARLLTSKLVVAIATIAVALVALVVWSLLVGTVAYGTAPFTNPAGGVLEWRELLPRVAAATAYLFVTFLQVAAFAFWMGVRTDAPLAAVGGAVLVTIVTSILGQIEPLGDLRHGLPLYYQRAFLDLFTPAIDWTGMRHGALWSLLYAVVFTALAYRTFRRKDVLS
ncbi:MAG TPA: ABC transporter permease [Dermatophilaceae bacterium]|jgi:ABC-2 type transport system permease protein|nr:ABC transporter permease [Dermatophilaceae bacterium]HMT88263.1 ABC transporter permease [Dermatophilaceae bacterium]